MFAMPTSRTPGSARVRDSSAATKLRVFVLSYARAGSDIFSDSAPSGLKPGSTDSSFVKLCSKSPAPVSSVTASAISPTTINRFVRLADGRDRTPPAPARSADVKSFPATCSAGSNPNARPVTIAISAVAASVVVSIEARAMSSTLWGARDRSSLMPTFAIARPTAAPQSESRTLSVMSCRTRRPRPAPSAVRTAISLSRAVARTSRRFATLAQAMSSTNATAPSMMSSGFRMSPTVNSCTVARWARRSRNSSGNLVSMSAETCSMSLLAVATSTPSRHASQHVHPPSAAALIAELIRREDFRNPQLGGEWIAVVARRDADDRVRRGVDAHHLADHRLATRRSRGATAPRR